MNSAKIKGSSIRENISLHSREKKKNQKKTNLVLMFGLWKKTKEVLVSKQNAWTSHFKPNSVSLTIAFDSG